MEADDRHDRSRHAPPPTIDERVNPHFIKLKNEIESLGFELTSVVRLYDRKFRATASDGSGLIRRGEGGGVVDALSVLAAACRDRVP